MLKIQLKQLWLVLITLLMIGFGLSLVYLALQNAFDSSGCETNDPLCECVDNQLVCESIPVEKKLTTKDFSIENLNFSAKFFSDIVSYDVENAALKTLFQSIINENSILRVTLMQSQLCTEKNKAPNQLGMYHFANGKLTLYSAVNDLAEVYDTPCNVEVVYEIKNFDLAGSALELFYQNEDGEKTAADICIYSGAVYNDGDSYKAEDGCNICECVNGTSRCANDNQCGEESSSTSPSVYWNFPDYDRYEEPEEAGECSETEDCFIRGCNNEVCSAKQEVVTSCEAVQIVEGATCGCVNTKCVWSK